MPKRFQKPTGKVAPACRVLSQVMAPKDVVLPKGKAKAAAKKAPKKGSLVAKAPGEDGGGARALSRSWFWG